MKFNKPIEIDLKLFFLTGKFDCIKPGQTKDWISYNFPDPEVADGEDHYGFSIWTYGSLEFHFDGAVLFLIWCDGLQYLESCTQLSYKKWFLEDNAQPILSYVLDLLNRDFVDYKVVCKKDWNSVRVKILKSNVVLHFEQTEDNDVQNPNEYPLIAFGLSRDGYENI